LGLLGAAPARIALARRDAPVKEGAQQGNRRAFGVLDILLKLRRQVQEDREQVEDFFRSLLRSRPSWLVPALLGYVARQARLEDARILYDPRLARLIFPDDLPW
jgi:hypothetical protein